jgi:hypothetical protein
MECRIFGPSFRIGVRDPAIKLREASHLLKPIFHFAYFIFLKLRGIDLSISTVAKALVG